MSSGIKVFAPASVSNVGCGFDIFGFALNEPGDEIVAKHSDKPGLTISEIIGAKGKLPFEIEKNTATVAAKAMLDELGIYDQVAIDFKIIKKMPFESGLGSSAASAVAGVMAVNELLKRPLEKRDLLPFAMKGEQAADKSWHADNVAPSLLGGFIIIRDNESLDVHRIPTPPGLMAVVVKPNVSISTLESRQALDQTVALSNHIRQSGNAAALVHAMYRGDFDLLSRSLQDLIIEPQRKDTIPFYEAVKASAYDQGCLGFNISGAGSSVFALCASSGIADKVSSAITNTWLENGIESKSWISSINHEGAMKM